MKKIILFFALLVAFATNYAQTTVLFVSVNNEFSLFNRPMPGQAIILNIADNKLYRLTIAAPANASLSSSSKIKLTSEETDPVWTIDKPSYATQSWVNAKNYLTSFTELDPLWTTDKPSYATQAWVNAKNYLTSFTELDPKWTTDKPSYATINYVDSKSSGYEKNFTSINNEFYLADSVLIPNNSIVQIESSCLSINNISKASTWTHRISFKRISNVIEMLPNVISVLNREEYVNVFNFSINNTTGYVRFIIKGDAGQKWKINYNYKILSI